MKALLEYIAAALVDEPSAVRVVEVRAGRESRLEIHVDSPEIGRVIGRQGRTARAIRSLLTVHSKKTGRRMRLEICG